MKKDGIRASKKLLLLLCRNGANGTYIVGIQNGSILKQHVVTFKSAREKSGQRCDTQVSTETWLSAQRFVLPLFVMIGRSCRSSLCPDVFAWAESMMEKVRGAVGDGISSINYFLPSMKL